MGKTGDLQTLSLKFNIIFIEQFDSEDLRTARLKKLF